MKLENLPAGLTTLHVENNQISKIENLPSTLQELFIENNQISRIENLPAGLQKLYSFNNPARDLEIIDIMRFFRSNGSEQRVLSIRYDWKLINEQTTRIYELINAVSKINSLKRFIRNRYSLNPYHPIGQRMIEELYFEYNGSE